MNIAQQAGNSQGVAFDMAMKQIGYPVDSAPRALGVVEMTSAAHQAFEVLSKALGEMISTVRPVTEPYPEPGSVGLEQKAPCEAPAITGLRILIERINDKTAEIQRLTAALRV